MKDLYYNGQIITMNGCKIVNGVVVDNGKIEIVGNFNDVDKIPNDAINKIDLKGMTMMPAFMDAHSHLTGVAKSLTLVDLNYTTSHEEVISRIQQFIEDRKFGDTEWVVGFGYDHNDYEGKKQLTATLLDEFKNPIMLTHKSGHVGVFNSKAMELLHITNADNGYLEEQAFLDAAAGVPEASFEELQASLREAEKIYLKNGITTVQDGFSGLNDVKLLAETPLDVDVVSYINYKEKDIILGKYAKYFKNYVGNFKIGGYKVILDGSPQARTAWLSKPYSGEQTYRGVPYYTDERLGEIVKNVVSEGSQILAHCNGDQASEQFLIAYYHAIKELEVNPTMRPVMIHAQTVRDDQIKRMAQLDMIPSFFVSHIKHFGDIHMGNLGRTRANKISPVRTALEYGLPFTLHQDSPVLQPNMIELIDSAVNRVTKSGQHLGTFEKVEAYEALEGITTNVAYQYFEEKTKGSIEEGKNADFVILSDNIYFTPKDKIGDIKVLATIKNGKVLYKDDGLDIEF